MKKNQDIEQQGKGKHGGRRQGAGRKRSIPAGCRPYSARVTDEEWRAMLDTLATIRRRSEAAPHPSLGKRLQAAVDAITHILK